MTVPQRALPLALRSIGMLGGWWITLRKVVCGERVCSDCDLLGGNGCRARCAGRYARKQGCRYAGVSLSRVLRGRRQGLGAGCVASDVRGEVKTPNKWVTLRKLSDDEIYDAHDQAADMHVMQGTKVRNG